MYRDHFLVTAAKQKPHLRGKILCLIVFLQQDTSWVESEKTAFLGTIRKALTRIEKVASLHSVYVEYKTHAMTLPAAGREYECPLMIDFTLARSFGVQYPFELKRKLKSEHGVDTVVPVFVLHSPYVRAFAWGTSCTLPREFREEVAIHELLHCHGAGDLYIETIRDVTEYALWNSVMLSSSNRCIDPLTRYLIGWDTEPNAVARFVLDHTSHISPEANATMKLVISNGLSSVYQQYVPFQSFAQLESESKEPFAAYLLGRCYDEGIYVKKDQRKAEAYYKAASYGCCAPAGFKLACKLLERAHPTQGEKALAHKLLLSLQHSPRFFPAITLYIVLLYTGKSMPQKFLDEAYLLAKSTFDLHRSTPFFDENKMSPALPWSLQQYTVFERLTENLPLLSQLITAEKKAYLRLVREGDPVLLYLASRAYLAQGDHKDAFEFCLEAANKGLSKACEGIATAYRTGIGVEKDAIAAQSWQQRAASAKLKEEASKDLTLRILNEQ